MCVVSEKDLMGEGHGRGMYIVSGRKTWQRSVWIMEREGDVHFVNG